MSMCESILTIALVCTVKYLHYCDYYYTLGNDSQSTPKLIAYDTTSEFDALCLPKEQRLVVDRLLTSYNESGAHYGKMTYQQGFRDCVSLLLEIGMIRDAKEEKVA